MLTVSVTVLEPQSHVSQFVPSEMHACSLFRVCLCPFKHLDAVSLQSQVFKTVAKCCCAFLLAHKPCWRNQSSMACCNCVAWPSAFVLRAGVDGIVDYVGFVIQGQRVDVPLPVTGVRQADWCAEGRGVRLAAEWHFKQHKHCPGVCTCCACCGHENVVIQYSYDSQCKNVSVLLGHNNRFSSTGLVALHVLQERASLHNVALGCDSHIALLALYTDKCWNWS